MKAVISGDRVFVNIDNKVFIAQKDKDVNYHKILKAVRDQNEDRVKELVLLEEVSVGKLSVSRSKVEVGGMTLHPDFANAYIYAAEAGKSAIEKFFTNVAKNPDENSRNDLAGFMVHNALPITDRGTFLAYRYVSEDFMDCHTGKIDNMIGNSVEMPRSDCDPDRNQTCSRGLHVCHYSYLANSGTTHLVVEINPRDVVAVPTDYNGAKMRVCRFRVLCTVDHFAEKVGAISDPLKTVPFVRMEDIDTEEVAGCVPEELANRYKPVDGKAWAEA
jgi:hypothetical protein